MVCVCVSQMSWNVSVVVDSSGICRALPPTQCSRPSDSFFLFIVHHAERKTPLCLSYIRTEPTDGLPLFFFNIYCTVNSTTCHYVFVATESILVSRG